MRFPFKIGQLRRLEARSPRCSPILGKRLDFDFKGSIGSLLLC
jgi:hypothetical protein